MSNGPTHSLVLTVHVEDSDEWNSWWERLNTLIETFGQGTTKISVSSHALPVISLSHPWKGVGSISSEVEDLITRTDVG